MQGKIALRTPKIKLPKFKMPSGKLGAILLALLVFAKVAKLPTIVSMGVMLWFYIGIYGWKLGALFLFFLAVHEYGHLYGAKKLGLRTTPAIFIPFIGALIALKDSPKNAKDEAYIAYMGPIFGTLSVLLTAVPMYFITHDNLWLVAILLGGSLNLFNLIPISPLDGGRIVAAISLKLWILGFLMIVAAALILKTFILFLVVFMACLELFVAYRKKKFLDKEEAKAIEEEKEAQQSLRDAIKAREEQHEELRAKIKNANSENYEEVLEQMKHFNRNMFDNEFVWRRKLMEIEITKETITTMKSYYQTDKKTKNKVFVVYLSLLLILGSWVYFSFSML